MDWKQYLNEQMHCIPGSRSLPPPSMHLGVHSRDPHSLKFLIMDIWWISARLANALSLWYMCTVMPEGGNTWTLYHSYITNLLLEIIGIGYEKLMQYSSTIICQSIHMVCLPLPAFLPVQIGAGIMALPGTHFTKCLWAFIQISWKFFML